jgi:hypothetical protein
MLLNLNLSPKAQLTLLDLNAIVKAFLILQPARLVEESSVHDVDIARAAQHNSLCQIP